jgi:hypothetical protein
MDDTSGHEWAFAAVGTVSAITTPSDDAIAARVRVRMTDLSVVRAHDFFGIALVGAVGSG